MKHSYLRRSTNIWLILIGLTLMAYLIGLFETSSLLFVAILVVSTFIKGKLIIDEFMGLKSYKHRWNNFPTLWLGVTLFIIGVLNFIGR